MVSGAGAWSVGCDCCCEKYVAAVDVVEGDGSEEGVVEVEVAEVEGRWGREVRLLVGMEETKEVEGDRSS